MPDNQLPIIKNDNPYNFEDWDKYYSYRFHCSNCSKSVVRWILKGIRIVEVEAECPNCGCTIKEGIGRNYAR